MVEVSTHDFRHKLPVRVVYWPASNLKVLENLQSFRMKLEERKCEKGHMLSDPEDVQAEVEAVEKDVQGAVLAKQVE